MHFTKNMYCVWIRSVRDSTWSAVKCSVILLFRYSIIPCPVFLVLPHSANGWRLRQSACALKHSCLDSLTTIEDFQESALISQGRS